MTSATSVEAAFRAELDALLKKWDAEIVADDHFVGYAECGQDLRMTVTIPAVYDPEGDTVREYTEFSLGKII